MTPEKKRLQQELLRIRSRLDEIKEEEKSRITPFGRNLSHYRKQKGMSQLDLADVLGITRVQITNVELGKGYTTVSNLLKLCEILEVTPNDLLLDAGAVKRNQ